MAFSLNNQRYFKAECLPERENYCQGLSLGNTGNLSYKDGSAVDLLVIAGFSAWLPPPSNPPLPRATRMPFQEMPSKINILRKTNCYLFMVKNETKGM